MRTLTVFSLAFFASSCLVAAVPAAETPSVELALTFQPVQKGVQIDSPPKSQYDECQVKVERKGKGSGWVVFGPQNQVLRRFVDTDGDNVVDHWRYYFQGLEVYRDIDSDGNNKVDQSRWLNTGGARWALDTNEDGRVDEWKVLSYEEASRVAVDAMRNADERALKPLLLTAEDARQLQLEDDVANEILEAVSNPGSKMRKILQEAKAFGAQSEWMRFDGSAPGIVPAEDGKAGRDLWVYENAMAIVQSGDQPVLVQLGELVRVGDVWKLTQIPQPLEGDTVQVTAGGVLMQPELDSTAPQTSPSGISPEAQKLLTQLQELDENAPAPGDGRGALVRYNRQRADLLARLVDVAENDQERDQWMQQMVDGLAAAVQTGGFPDGLQRLQSIEADIRENQPDSTMLPYVTYRRLLAEYSTRMQQATNEQRPEVQKWWLGQLQSFAEAHPDSEDTADALLQLAIAQEFGGQPDAAREWYRKLAEEHAGTTAGERASGALRRLNVEGQRLALSGQGLRGGNVDLQDYRGKVTLVVFWATWSQPFVQELPPLRELMKQHGSQGFRIVGVNLDMTAEPARQFVSQQQLDWPQIHEQGGLESAPAKSYGIVALPTMFLLDRQGKVVASNPSLAELKKQLPQLLGN